MKYLPSLLLVFLVSCMPNDNRLTVAVSSLEESEEEVIAVEEVDTVEKKVAVEIPQCEKSTMAQYLDSLGFVNIAVEDPSIRINLKYATADNFVGEVLYKDLHEAYLHPKAMECLKKAQANLKEKHPNYSLIVYDAARPMSVQQQMWNKVKTTKNKNYVSNPANGGGLHNYGLAVDISIVDENGKALDMGTPFDFFGIEAHTSDEPTLVAKGKITEEQRQNRLLLRGVMREAGFRPLQSEWWHFNYCSRAEAKKNFKAIP